MVVSEFKKEAISRVKNLVQSSFKEKKKKKLVLVFLLGLDFDPSSC